MPQPFAPQVSQGRGSPVHHPRLPGKELREWPLHRFVHNSRAQAIEEPAEENDCRTTRSNTPSLTVGSTHSGSPSLSGRQLTESPQTHYEFEVAPLDQDFWSPSIPKPPPIVTPLVVSGAGLDGDKALLEPEVDVDSSDSDSGSDDGDSSNDDWSGQGDDIEPMVLAAVGNDLKLAAYLIPILYRKLSAEASCTVNRKIGHWQSMLASHERAYSSQQGDHGYSGHVESASLNQQQAGNPLKRRRRSSSSDYDRDLDDDGEGDEREDKGGEEQGDHLDGKSTQLPRLACPFHKLDPRKYAIQHGVQDSQRKTDYKSCSGPGFKSIQRLKEHLKRKHHPVQCDRCFEVFRGAERSGCMLQLEAHRQQPEPCKKGDPSWREGVSDAQWAKLDGKRGSKHSQEKHRVEKWFEIWVVLFPDEPRPDTPWYDESSDTGPRMLRSRQSASFMALFSAILDHKIQHRDIVLDKALREQVEKVADIAFTTWLGSGRQGASTDSSSLTRSYAHPSMVGGSSTDLPSLPSHGRYLQSHPSSGGHRSQASSGSFRSHQTRPAVLLDPHNPRTMQTSPQDAQFDVAWSAMSPSTPRYINPMDSLQRQPVYANYPLDPRRPTTMDDAVFSPGLSSWNASQGSYTEQNAFTIPAPPFSIPVSGDGLEAPLLETPVEAMSDIAFDQPI